MAVQIMCGNCGCHEIVRDTEGGYYCSRCHRQYTADQVRGLLYYTEGKNDRPRSVFRTLFFVTLAALLVAALTFFVILFFLFRPIQTGPLSPVEGVTVEGENRFMLWNAVDGAREYEIAFTSPEGRIYSYLTDGNYWFYSELPPGTYTVSLTAKTGGQALSEPTNFTLSVTGTVDTVAWVNHISETCLPANVTVHATVTGYSSRNVYAAQGSGVIFACSGDTYYVLTNYHVAYPVSDGRPSYEIYDAKGQPIPARFITASTDYDLALFSFRSESEHAVVPLSEADPALGQAVAAVGQPGGQWNTITLGSVSLYTTVDLTESFPELTVTDSVICHTAPIDLGSSGGMLLNTDCQLVGVNFAGGETESGAPTVSYAVPVSLIRAFLEEVGYGFLL